MEEKGGEEDVPRTIRLKRPGESTAKAAPTLDTIKAAPAKAALSQTSRIDDQAIEEAEGPTATRRKTIKVKRPSERPGIRVADAEGPAPAAAATVNVAGTVEEKTEGVGVFDWIAVAAALVTILTTLMVIVMLASQAWGPNPCLTELSGWKTGPNFSWTGKTPPLMQ